MKVMKWTWEPLTAHRVTGTVCVPDQDAAEKVSLTRPLETSLRSKEALTPPGSPVIEKFTEPVPKDERRTRAVAEPELIA